MPSSTRLLRTLLVPLAPFAVVACAGSTPDSPGGGGGTDLLEVEVRTGQDRYAPGEEVELVLTVRNTGPEPVTLGFTSGQRYDFRIEEPGGRIVWSWSAARSFIQVLGEETFPPGEEARWTARAELDLEPGEYTAVGMVTNREGPLAARTEFMVR